jgi:transposase-like protein
MGRYSNLCEQGERLRSLLEMVPSGPPKPISRTHRQIQRRLRGNEIEQLVAGYQAGATVYELAEQFGVHRGTVSDVLERRGVARRFGPISPAQVATASSLYEGGLSLAKVGQQLGCHATTVREALTKAGVEIRPRNGW